MARMAWVAFGFAGLVLFSAACAAAPALIVEVKCKPGTADLWAADFQKEMQPAINDAIAKGDSYTRFRFVEAALPGQHFDFILIYESKSFAGLDVKRPFPQNLALYRRVGAERAKQILTEMMSWEEDVHISLGRTGEP
jgi:hypothetical protein